METIVKKPVRRQRKASRHESATSIAGAVEGFQHRCATPDEIRLLAYSKWEEAGRPCGDGVEFWLAAEREFQFANGIDLNPALPELGSNAVVC